MTDHDPLDDLASAHLDGATSPEEAARIAADPALQARVDALRAVRAAVGATPSVDPVRRDAAIAAALAAFEDAGREDTDGRPRAPVTSLTEVAARRGPSTRMLRLVGAAAVVLLLAALVPLVASLELSSDDDSAQDSFTETGAAIGDEDASGGEGAPEAAAGTTSTASDQRANPLLALGEYDSLDDLAASLDQTPGLASGGYAFEDGDDDGDAGADSPTCFGALPTAETATGAQIVGRALASIGGVPVVVAITTDDEGHRSLRAYRADDCTLLGERRL